MTNQLVWDPSGDVPQVIDAYAGEGILTRLAYGNDPLGLRAGDANANQAGPSGRCRSQRWSAGRWPISSPSSWAWMQTR